MRRTLFFWLEKLQISRAERRSVSLLLVLLMLLVILNGIIHPALPFQQDYYHALEEEFHRRTVQLQQKERSVLSRYGIAVAPDTLPADSVAAVAPLVVVDINAVSASRLETLPGIGPTYARRIITYRQEHGPFTTKGQLLQIKGIGPARLAKLKPLITVNIKQATDSLKSQKSLPVNPTEEETPQAAPDAINVNTADVATLKELPGVGPVYARRIVAYRQENGVFTSKNQLLQINGIGKKRLAKLKPFIKLTDK